MTKAPLWILVVGVLAILAAAVYALVIAAQSSLHEVTSLTDRSATAIAHLTQPTPTFYPDPVTVIYSVRSLARLETIQYSVEKIITAESGQGPLGFLFGDKLLLVAHGTVIAGVDLGRMTNGDVWVQEGGIVHIRLPAPEIFTATLDNSKTYIYDRNTGPLAPSQSTLETQARQEAEKDIRDAALSDGILAIAGQNAEAYLERFLLSLGFRKVMFEWGTPVPTGTPKSG
jgi:hypothetical protein